MSPIPHRVSKALLLLLGLVLGSNASFCQAPLSHLKLTDEQDSRVHDLLSRILEQTKRVGCPKVGCTILVMNFVDAGGNTSNLGMRLAERVSHDGIFPVNGTRTISSDDLRKYLERERIPARSLDDPKAQLWLAKELSGDVALVGRISKDGDKLNIQIQLIGVRESFASDVSRSNTEHTSITYVANLEELAPSEPFGDITQPVINGERIEKLRADEQERNSSMTMPFCAYKPDPPYSESARQSKYQGFVILQTMISKDGRMLDVRPLMGAPYGLNKISVDTVSTWKCKPATLQGRPISVVVPVEVSFKLF